MIPKSALVCLTFFLLLTFVLGLNPDQFKYDKGFHQIIKGDIKPESLLYKGVVTGVTPRYEYWKEVCYPNNAFNKVPNERVIIKGFNVTDYSKDKNEAVVFHTGGGVNDNQVCWFFLTKPDGRMSFQVSVYGKRTVDKEPPIKPGQVLRQQMNKEMFQEPYELPPLKVSRKSALAPYFEKHKKFGNRDVIIVD